MTVTVCYPDGSDVREGDLVLILSVVSHRFGTGIVRAVLCTSVEVEKQNGEIVGYANTENQLANGLRLLARSGGAAAEEEGTP